MGILRPRPQAMGNMCCDGVGVDQRGTSTVDIFLSSSSLSSLLNDCEGEANSKEMMSPGEKMEMSSIQITSMHFLLGAHAPIWLLSFLTLRSFKIAEWLP